MPIEIIGDQEIAKEVLDQIKHWDSAVVTLDIDQITNQCAEDVSMFDVSSQMNGIEEYKTEWYKFSPYFNENMQISRRNIKVYTSDDLAVVHCFSKVEHKALLGKLKMPWCRTTICMKKDHEQWLLVHQHISMPINLTDGKAIALKDEPKLRLLG